MIPATALELVVDLAVSSVRLLAVLMRSLAGLMLLTFLFAWFVVAVTTSAYEEETLARRELEASTSPACVCPGAEQNR